MPEDLNKLIEEAKRGNKEAFGEIYRLFLSRIYRFIYYLVYDEPLAEDLTQETFVRVWKAMPGFSPKKGTLQAYLFTIARNLVIDSQRKKREFPLTDEAAETFESEQNLEKNVVESEEKQIVKEALSALEPEEKQIVILRFFEELSYSEISKVVRKNEGAIRVQIHRLLGKLKVYLERNNK